MSTRDEILAALTDCPVNEGLTSKELAPKCPSAECDSIIVGAVIATLRSENVIHAAEEKRDGSTVWVFGPVPAETVAEHVGLPEFNRRAAGESHISEAARAIAAMRVPPASHRAPSRAPTPVTTSSPDALADQSEDEDMNARERVLKLIEKAGDAGVKSKPIQKICGTKSKAGTLTNALIAEKLIRREGSTRSTRYFLHGTKAAAASAPAPRKSNGNGESIYALTLADLQWKRAALVEEHAVELAKLDRAIEAVGALA